MDENHRWWEPVAPTHPLLPSWMKVYWPPGVPLYDLSVANFERAYETCGFERCIDGSRERGYEKIALYAKQGAVTHTARQLPSGRWTSKLGKDIDIMHPTVASLEASGYGAVVAYMRRGAWARNVPKGKRPHLGGLAAAQWAHGFLAIVRRIRDAMSRSTHFYCVASVPPQATLPTGGESASNLGADQANRGAQLLDTCSPGRSPRHGAAVASPNIELRSLEEEPASGAVLLERDRPLCGQLVERMNRSESEIGRSLTRRHPRISLRRRRRLDSNQRTQLVQSAVIAP
jgi:hypothetical protein